MTQAQQTAAKYNETFIGEVSKYFITQDGEKYNLFHTATGICQGSFSNPVNAYKFAEAL